MSERKKLKMVASVEAALAGEVGIRFACESPAAAMTRCRCYSRRSACAVRATGSGSIGAPSKQQAWLFVAFQAS